MSIFQLEIAAEEARNHYSVKGSYETETSAAESVHLLIPKNVRRAIELLHERTEAFGPPTDLTAYDKICIVVGKFLFQCVFIGDVDRLYRKYMDAVADEFKPRLIIRMPRTLYPVPWELLVDSQDPNNQFLAIRGSVIRGDSELPLSTKIVPQPTELSILYFCASPIDRAFNAVTFSSPFVREVPRATFTLFRDSFAGSPHAVVLHGHGDVHTPAEPQFGRFNFIDAASYSEPYTAQAVASRFVPSLRTALIVACDSAWTQKKLEFERTFAGGLFTRSALDFVVGMQRDVDAIAGSKFLERLVECLVKDRQSLDAAIREGRREILAIAPSKPGQKSSPLNWWIPVVYTKSTILRALPGSDPQPALPLALAPGPTVGSIVSRSPETNPIKVLQNPSQTIRGVAAEFMRRLLSALH